MTIKIGTTEIQNEGNATLSAGSNTLTIDIASGGLEQTYTVTITKESDTTLLESLKVGNSTIALADGTYAYTATTTAAKNKITAVPADPDATVTIESSDATISGDEATWEVGTNVVTITVANTGVESTVYTLTVTKS